MNIWWGYIRQAGWAVLFSSPLVLYTAAAFRFDPYAKIWAAQNQLPSPHPLHYILAYGLVLPLVVYGAVQIIRKERWRGWLPVSWVMVFPFWVYASVSIQRRLAEGVWVAMSVLVMAAIEKWRKGQRKAYQPVWLSIMFFTTMFLLVGSMQAAVNLRMPIFRPAQETQFFKAVRSQVEDGSVVLASFNTSNSLPAWAPVRVVIGHGPESVAVEENTQVAEAFYRVDTDDSARQKLLYEQGIDYVIFGPEEARLGEWFPINDAYLTFIFGMEDYYLFKVRE
jgi:hypothetical protein